jgi:hypothetical protein
MWTGLTYRVVNLKQYTIGTIPIGSGATTTVSCISFRLHSGSGADVYAALMVVIEQYFCSGIWKLYQCFWYCLARGRRKLLLKLCSEKSENAKSLNFRIFL